MLSIRNISYLPPMCCNFLKKCTNSHKIVQGCITPLNRHDRGCTFNQEDGGQVFFFFFFFFLIYCYDIIVMLMFILASSVLSKPKHVL